MKYLKTISVIDKRTADHSLLIENKSAATTDAAAAVTTEKAPIPVKLSALPSQRYQGQLIIQQQSFLLRRLTWLLQPREGLKKSMLK